VSVTESLGVLGYLGYLTNDLDDVSSTTSVEVHLSRTSAKRASSWAGPEFRS
jgi:hypothetical protein